jgi:ketosteroid isomerase-like protein
MSHDLLQRESAVLQAIIDRRWDLLADELHDEFVITTAGWLAAPAAKQEWIDEVAARHELHRFEVRSLDVRSVGATTVVLMLSTQWATWKGEPFQGDFRYTDVWHPDESGRQRLAVRHATLVPSA